MRLRQEKGFGMLELLMAITLLNVGILAIVASFNSGAVALRRASRTATAATLADSQMELYRGITYANIALDTTATNGADSTYKNDPVVGGNVSSEVMMTCSGSPLPNSCNPSRTATGADHHIYRVDTYITSGPPTTAASPQPSGRNLKTVTVVVRDGRSPYGQLAREQSTFDQSTGI